VRDAITAPSFRNWIDKLRFSFSLERCAVQIPQRILVVGDLFTDLGRCLYFDT